MNRSFTNAALLPLLIFALMLSTPAQTLNFTQTAAAPVVTTVYVDKCAYRSGSL